MEPTNKQTELPIFQVFSQKQPHPSSHQNVQGIIRQPIINPFISISQPLLKDSQNQIEKIHEVKHIQTEINQFSSDYLNAFKQFREHIEKICDFPEPLSINKLTELLIDPAFSFCLKTLKRNIPLITQSIAKPSLHSFNGVDWDDSHKIWMSEQEKYGSLYSELDKLVHRLVNANGIFNIISRDLNIFFRLLTIEEMENYNQTIAILHECIAALQKKNDPPQSFIERFSKILVHFTSESEKAYNLYFSKQLKYQMYLILNHTICSESQSYPYWKNRCLSELDLLSNFPPTVPIDQFIYQLIDPMLINSFFFTQQIISKIINTAQHPLLREFPKKDIDWNTIYHSWILEKDTFGEVFEQSSLLNKTLTSSGSFFYTLLNHKSNAPFEFSQLDIRYFHETISVIDNLIKALTIVKKPELNFCEALIKVLVRFKAESSQAFNECLTSIADRKRKSEEFKQILTYISQENPKDVPSLLDPHLERISSELERCHEQALRLFREGPHNNQYLHTQLSLISKTMDELIKELAGVNLPDQPDLQGTINQLIFVYNPRFQILHKSVNLLFKTIKFELLAPHINDVNSAQTMQYLADQCSTLHNMWKLFDTELNTIYPSNDVFQIIFHNLNQLEFFGSSFNRNLFNEVSIPFQRRQNQN